MNVERENKMKLLVVFMIALIISVCISTICAWVVCKIVCAIDNGAIEDSTIDSIAVNDKKEVGKEIRNEKANNRNEKTNNRK